MQTNKEYGLFFSISLDGMLNVWSLEEKKRIKQVKISENVRFREDKYPFGDLIVLPKQQCILLASNGQNII